MCVCLHAHARARTVNHSRYQLFGALCCVCALVYSVRVIYNPANGNTHSHKHAHTRKSVLTQCSRLTQDHKTCQIKKERKKVNTPKLHWMKCEWNTLFFCAHSVDFSVIWVSFHSLLNASLLSFQPGLQETTKNTSGFLKLDSKQSSHNMFWWIFFFTKFCCIDVAKVSQNQCFNSRSLGKKCCFFSCSKAERKELGTTFSIILCVPLALTDLDVEQRWWMQQVVMEKWEAKFVKF